jgi:hypothetical protein
VGAHIGDWTGGRRVAKEVVIAEGQLEASVTLRFDEGVRLEGQVTRAGVPVPGAMVWLSQQSGRSHVSGTSDAEGYYVLSGLAHGTWELALRLSDSGSMGLRREVELSGDTRLDLELDTGRLAGRVVDGASGRPLAGVNVGVENPDGGWMGSSNSDSDGRFAIENLQPIRYRVHVRKTAYQQKVLQLQAAETSDVVIELERGEGIAIEARDARYGTPLPGLEVKVLDASGAPFYAGRVLLDSEGRGELQSLPPGSYRLLAGLDGYATTSELPLNSPSSRVSVQLTRGGSLEVLVGPETAALEGAGIRLLRPDGSSHLPRVFSNDAEIPLRGPTLRLDHVLAGEYLLLVTGGGSHRVVVGEGAAASLRLP